jgi:hypothetical protein
MYEQNAGVYKPSGRLGTSLFIVPIVALIGTLLASVAYAYVTVYCPIAGYVSILFVGGYAFALAFTVAFAGYVSKCRNPALLHLAGFLTGLFGVYCSWAAFVYVLVARQGDILPDGMIILDMYLLPQAIWEITLEVNKNGWYEIRGGTPTGIALWIMWGIEALVIVGLPTLLATMKIDGVVFCEDCRCWCKATEKAARLSLPANIEELDALRQGDIATLAQLQTVAGEDPHLAIDTQKCPKCSETGAFQTKLVQYEVDKEGKVKEQTADVTELLLVSQATVAEIAALGQRPVVAPPAVDDEASEAIDEQKNG